MNGRVRTVEVRGCLPALLVLLALGALVAVAATFGAVLAVAGAVALLLAGLGRALARRLGVRPPGPPPPPASEAIVEGEVIVKGPAARDDQVPR